VRRLQLSDLLVIEALKSANPSDWQHFVYEETPSWSALDIVRRNDIDWQQAQRFEEEN
jgi:hypothetical protein